MEGGPSSEGLKNGKKHARIAFQRRFVKCQISLSPRGGGKPSSLFGTKIKRKTLGKLSRQRSRKDGIGHPVKKGMPGNEYMKRKRTKNGERL